MRTKLKNLLDGVNMFIKKFLKDMKLAIGHSLSRLSPRDELVSQGVELFFQKQRVLFVHLEFSPFCNKRCSYCCDGNGMIGGKKVSFSAENDYVGAVQKIHDIVKDDDFVCFIIAGGEAALQPSLKTVVDTIYQRNNSIAILTTNLTSSVEFYNKLNIPLICSLHLEDTDPNNFLEKVMTLNHLMAHVRIMAHPKKMELVNYAYNMFKKTPLNFAVERIMPFGDFTESYTKGLFRVFRG